MYLFTKFLPKTTTPTPLLHPKNPYFCPFLPFLHLKTNKNRGKVMLFLVGANLAKSIDLAKKSKKV
jgi:hypothetical protein